MMRKEHAQEVKYKRVQQEQAGGQRERGERRSARPAGPAADCERVDGLVAPAIDSSKKDDSSMEEGQQAGAAARPPARPPPLPLADLPPIVR